jgi:hypothetical protein
MAGTGDKKAFCVLQFAKTESVVTLQRRSRAKYHTEPSTDKTIREWYEKFEQSRCLCGAIHREMLQRVWQELEYRIDVCRVTKGGYIEQL